MRLLFLLLFSFPALAQTWSQWGGGPRHTGSLDVVADRFEKLLAEEVVDPFVPFERAEVGGSLLVHYQTPLSDGRELFMEVKSGSYITFRTWETQVWSIRKFEWEGKQLVTRWTTSSDWDPVPWASGGPVRFEPVFHAALTSSHVYMPAAGGTIMEVDRNTGAVTRRLGLFGATIDSTTYVTSPITIDTAGNIYYNTLRLNSGAPWASDHQGAWLVKIAPDGSATRVSYATLVPNAPSMCTTVFSSGAPYPPSPNAVAPSAPCGSIRAGINVAPAVAPDGTIYTAARAHFNERWGWFIAVNGNLTRKWSTSMRNIFNDGCGVLLPFGNDAFACRPGSTAGVDPFDNQRGSGGVTDNSTSSPVVAPDGTIYYGSFTRYNHSQGHMVRFTANGQVLQSYKFGWDVSPAIWEHDGTFSVITKENRYPSQPARMPGDEEGYYLTQLSPELSVQWQYKNTNTLTCERQEDGSLDCANDRPDNFEWCVNSLAVDARGVVYVNSEDGNLYAINQGGTLRERIFLQLAVGAAYTPLSLGADGRIYTQNAGILFVVGSDAKKRRAIRH